MTSNIPYEPQTKRAKLPPGPWDIEQNLYKFTAHGLTCAVMRMPHNGVLNGYVRVPIDAHIDTNTLEVHGGITYHYTNERGQWIGFDCSHAWDARPKDFGISDWLSDQVYRDARYVIAQTENLARQVDEQITNNLFAFNYEATPC